MSTATRGTTTPPRSASTATRGTTTPPRGMSTATRGTTTPPRSASRANCGASAVTHFECLQGQLALAPLHLLARAGENARQDGGHAFLDGAAVPFDRVHRRTSASTLR
jgi:hypothetical protein